MISAALSAGGAQSTRIGIASTVIGVNSPSAQAGTRAQAPPATLAERHGRRGSQATWSRTLPFPAAVPAGCGPLRGKPACDLLWRLADGDSLMGVQLGLMGVQLGGKVIWAGLRGCGCGSGTAAPSDTLAQSSDLRRRLCARSYEEFEQLIFAGQDHGVQVGSRSRNGNIPGFLDDHAVARTLVKQLRSLPLL
jgi:hypothetical protein